SRRPLPAVVSPLYLRLLSTMLRPATPLSILLLAAFVLLLLSVLTTPVIKGIPLANFEDVDFGVFGYCTPDECSGIRVGYSTGTFPSVDCLLSIHILHLSK